MDEPTDRRNLSSTCDGASKNTTPKLTLFKMLRIAIYWRGYGRESFRLKRCPPLAGCDGRKITKRKEKMSQATYKLSQIPFSLLDSRSRQRKQLDTVGQNNQEYRLRYSATRSSICSFARTPHSFACSGLLALLTGSAVLTHLLARSLRSHPRSWDSE